MRMRWMLAAGAVAIAVAAALAFSFASRGGQGGATGGETQSGPYRGSEPPTRIEAPAFALRSYRGSLVRMRALRGKVVLVTFLDTGCRESCPIIASVIGAAIPRLTPDERREVEAVALSVDPEIDTPRRIRRFLAERRALGALDFLIGPLETMRPVWKAFYALSAAETGDADSHSADVRIFDRRGVWVATLHPGADLTEENLVHDIRVALGRR